MIFYDTSLMTWRVLLGSWLACSFPPFHFFLSSHSTAPSLPVPPKRCLTGCKLLLGSRGRVRLPCCQSVPSHTLHSSSVIFTKPPVSSHHSEQLPVFRFRLRHTTQTLTALPKRNILTFINAVTGRPATELVRGDTSPGACNNRSRIGFHIGMRRLTLLCMAA